MTKLLEIQFSGWTATPRMPFVLSGNALCMHTPSYSIILGIVGCCMGRIVLPEELKIGFKYIYNSVAQDLETRQRLEFKGNKIKSHTKGSDAYLREFHTLPTLTVWIDRTDWMNYFENPVGTPSLGRSQDILKIDYVREVDVVQIDKGELAGSMLPFTSDLQVGGQLVQLAESFEENEDIGFGRRPKHSKVFITIPQDNKTEIEFHRMFKTVAEPVQTFYLHEFGNE